MLEINGIQFPKPIMTITELEELGFSKKSLQMYTHCKNSDAFKEGKLTSTWRIPVKSYMQHIDLVNRKRPQKKLLYGLQT